MAGTPFANRKMQINATANIDIQAVNKNTPRINISFIYMFSPSLL